MNAPKAAFYSPTPFVDFEIYCSTTTQFKLLAEVDKSLLRICVISESSPGFSSFSVRMKSAKYVNNPIVKALIGENLASLEVPIDVLLDLDNIISCAIIQSIDMQNRGPHSLAKIILNSNSFRFQIRTAYGDSISGEAKLTQNGRSELARLVQ